MDSGPATLALDRGNSKWRAARRENYAGPEHALRAETVAATKGRIMKERVAKKVDLGRCGAVTLHLSADKKRLLLEFETEPDGLDKTGLNAFIDALKKIREKMDR